MGLHYRDERFSRGGFEDCGTNPAFAQRCLIEDGAIVCETVAEAGCGAAQALRAVYGPWDWWDHGSVSGFQWNAEGSFQVLAPVTWFVTRIGLQQFDPVPVQAREFPGWMGHRIGIILSRHFRGTASVDIFEEPDSGAGIILRGRFHGVRNHIPGTPTWLAASMHLRAEAGRMYWPFPQETGYCGLLRRLERMTGGADA